MPGQRPYIDTPGPRTDTSWVRHRSARHHAALAGVIGAALTASPSVDADDIGINGETPAVLADSAPAGLRDAAAAHGLSFDVTGVGDYSLVLDGGASPRASAARYLIEAGVTLDTARAFGLPGGKLRAAYVGFHGDNGNLDTGDLQVYSNIDETPFDAFYALWYRQSLFNDHLALKIGKMDINDDFAYVDNGQGFIHSSPGFSPTVLGFPSYPDPATGVAVFASLPSGWYARAGIYDGSSLNGRRTGTRGPRDFLTNDDRFTIGEAGLDYRLGDRTGRLGVGYWRHASTLERFDGGTDNGSDGLYIVWDQSLYADPTSTFAIDGFAQYGQADDTVSEMTSHVGAGVQITGLFQGRDADVTGFMASRVGLSNAPGADFTADQETAIEVFHAVRATNWLTIKPDFQYIINPGGMGLDDARVATLRVEANI
ncbi:carbohydrate porin [Salinisphaera sp. Q1T1-3]|uniref:carbohydrate porin n=1 Tax=Salinisphaera sp. Q1T1-3 TaxID=2321229 RepID=UPI000E769E7F|nr:carbohydrate porin [Salinisphaera sp. Q1T1-3]RJS94105.1 hypothetical protein D3260_05950 [Salinisphaera sp. Q1T1-3]